MIKSRKENLGLGVIVTVEVEGTSKLFIPCSLSEIRTEREEYKAFQTCRWNISKKRRL
jgi:hypothetical protein